MKSYLKFLSRNKLYTAVEAVGLVVSLAFVIILVSYAWQQYAASRSTPDGDRVYSLGMPDYLGLTYGLPEIVKERVPEVEMIGVYCPGYALLKGKEEDELTYANVNEDFFHVFSNIRFVEGSPSVLSSEDNAIVSHAFATRHHLEPGSIIELTAGNLLVAAIIDDIEGSILPNVDFYISERKWNESALEDPFDHFGNTIPFIKAMPGIDRKALYDKIETICKEIYPDDYGQEDWFDYLDMPCVNELFFKKSDTDPLNRGDSNSIRILLLAGLLLLLSAMFNYINLNLAMAGKRTKEMAVRRMVGATETCIRLKYWAESVFFTAVCFLLAVMVAYMLVPVMNTLLNDPNVPIRVDLKPVAVAVYVLLVIVVGTLAGLQPARLVSRFKPVEVMKGGYRHASKMRFNKVFIVIQNILAVFLIVMAVVMECQYRQSLYRPQHARTADLYYLTAWGNINRQPIYDALTELPCVSRVGFCQGAPGMSDRVTGQHSSTVEGKVIIYRLFRVDSAAFSMLEPKIVENFHASIYNSVWFGRKAFKATGLTSNQHDISQTLATRTRGCEQVAGIIEDWVTNGTNRGDEEFMILSVQRSDEITYGGFLIETSGNRTEAAKAIANAVQKVKGETEILIRINRSGYLDDFISKTLQPQRNAMRLIEIFMLLAILISLLGLVAMSTYYAGENAKSFAVRKVFGGTVKSETWRTVREYMLLVAVACVIGVPVAVWAVQRYLEGFIVRLEHYGWIFLVAVVISLAMAFLSVLWQTLRAAKTNPAEALKKE